MSSVERCIADITEELTTLRRELHAWPEPGFEEERTQARVREALLAIGLQPRVIAKTGLMADLVGGPGPVIALRADLDALPMTEENEDLPWRSQRPGFAHMCGHDGHTTTLIGAAKVLAAHKDQLKGTVRFLFQPAEEGPGGAPVMIAEGALEGVDEVYGMHNIPVAPLGSLWVRPGPVMASVAEFDVELTGVGGHASMPHRTVDPVTAAAQIVTALQTIVSRNLPYEDMAVLTVTCIHAGEAKNVIPDTAKIEGTVRTLSNSAGDLIEKRFHEIVNGVAQALGVQAAIDYDRQYPVVVNTEKETEHVARVGRELLGADKVGVGELPMLGAEDFAYYLEHRPGCFYFLGGGGEGRSNSMCHATDYDYNDDLLPIGVRFWVGLIADRLGVQLG